MVSVVVVNFNTLPYLKLTLASILEKTKINYELIIIDNHSTDGSQEWLSKTFSRGVEVHLQLNDKNQGYSFSCNQGFNMARGDYLVFLNSDIMVSPFWLKRLKAHFSSVPRVGAVGPMGLAIGGQQNYVGIYKERVYPYPGDGNLDHFAEQVYNKYRGSFTETKFLIGCCLMTKREVLKTVGGFDPSLFMSADDFDFSLRVRLAGYRLLVAEDVFVHHFNHRAFQTLTSDKQKEYVKIGWQKFRHKWGDMLQKYSLDDLFYNQKKVFYQGLVKGRRKTERE